MEIREHQVLTLLEPVRLGENQFFGAGSQVIVRERLDGSDYKVSLVNDQYRKWQFTTSRDKLTLPSFSAVRGRYYLAGPMTGLPDNNYPAFHEAARKLRDLGFEIVSPAEINYDAPKQYKDIEESGMFDDDKAAARLALRTKCLRKDLAGLITCHGIISLPGSVSSPGVEFEYTVAKGLNMVFSSLGEMTNPSVNQFWK